jgi:hypothetical protein
METESYLNEIYKTPYHISNRTHLRPKSKLASYDVTSSPELTFEGLKGSNLTRGKGKLILSSST